MLPCDNSAPTIGKTGTGEGNKQSTKQNPKTATRLYGSIIEAPKKIPVPMLKGTGANDRTPEGLAASLDKTGHNEPTQPENQTRADVNGVVGHECGDSIHNVSQSKSSGIFSFLQNLSGGL